MTYKINYDSKSTLVLGKYPTKLYENAPEPNIEISDAEYKTIFGDGLFQTPCVVNEVIQEYIIPDSVLLEQGQQSKTAQCQAYLEGTDWQAAALIKYGRPLDANVAENCLKSKQWKIDIDACTTLKELNNININFE